MAKATYGKRAFIWAYGSIMEEKQGSKLQACQQELEQDAESLHLNCKHKAETGNSK